MLERIREIHGHVNKQLTNHSWAILFSAVFNISPHYSFMVQNQTWALAIFVLVSCARLS